MRDVAPLDVLQNWLDTYLNFERLPQKDMFWLDTMEYLCRICRNPEKNYKSVHIAGSKGKGSVSVMTSSILEAAGLSCGLYTSPHILSLSERISKPHDFFSNEVYEQAVRTIMPLIDAVIPDNLPNKREPTWFELITLFAFIVFSQSKVDWAVFETGLGGRLDATNVILPEISIITPIELEHTEYLGDTVEKIAAEKAGIIKKGVPVCISSQTPSVRAVFEQKAADLQSPIVFIDDVIDSSAYKYTREGMHITIHFKNLFKRPISTVLKLPGSFQVYNAAAAAYSMKMVMPGLDESVIEKGLSQASLQARFEMIEHPRGCENIPLLVIDGAHTYNSIKFTLETLEQMKNIYAPEKKTEVIFACAADKKCSEFAPLFFLPENSVEHITITRPGIFKQTDIDAVQNAFEQASAKFGFDYSKVCSRIEDHEQAIAEACSHASMTGNVLLVIGSFYLAAEVKKHLFS